jgi:hypothetical protein
MTNPDPEVKSCGKQKRPFFYPFLQGIEVI